MAKPSLKIKGLDDATRVALAAACRPYVLLPGVTGFGFGPKNTAGTTGAAAIIFYVARKFDRPEDIILAGSKAIPEAITVAGVSYPTDIVEENWVRSADGEGRAIAAARTAWQDPVCPGISVGDAFDARISGTIGAIVRVVRPGQANDGQVGVLSNHHVLVHPAAGGLVNQPGRRDDDGGKDPGLGHVIDKFVDVDGDAAVAGIEHRHVVREIFGLGVAVERVARPMEGQLLVMAGRSTARAFGRAAVDGIQQVTLPKGRVAPGIDSGTTLMNVFKVDLQGGVVPVDGDSGAPWMLCDANGEPTSTMVGLHVGTGASSGFPIVCFADRVFSRLGIVPASASDVAAFNAVPHAAPVALDGALPLMAVAAAPGTQRRVVARNGAFLRPTPMRRETQDRLLPFGTRVMVVAEMSMADGSWCQVDLEGDGRTDGFVHGSLLERFADGPAIAPPPVGAGSAAIDRLTTAMVMAMFPNLGFVRANIVKHLPHVTAGLRGSGLVDRDMVLMALATIRAESEGFAPINEGVSSLNTSVRDFDRYEPGTSIGADLGNTQPGDGARFHGRGFIQLTGRSNYEKIGLVVGAALVGQPALANDPAIAGQILAAFLKRREQVIRAALALETEAGLKAARKAVNGGSHGFARFKEAWTTGRQLLV